MEGRSEVWSVFEKVEDEKKAKCSLCFKKLAYLGGTTSNLRNNLERARMAQSGES